jgi:hypothetical protein
MKTEKKIEEEIVDMVNNVSSVEEMLEREILEIIYCSYC